MVHTASFGYWLRRRRKALDLTQADLAQRVGCSLDTIHKIEADERRPSRQVAERLADCLELDAAERAAFVQAARAERATDQLALAAQPIERPPAALPQGTVTFLLTDIEGSTRLWERDPQAMPAALDRHDTLLHAIVAAHGGVIFKTVGDGVLAAFARAPDALAAALEGQRAVAAEPWGLPEPLRLRMALHSGSAEIRNGDYFGPALNRAARLLQAGHGGQVLLSLAAEELAREQLPPGAGLRDLGRHRLKDLSLPEQIFQLLAPDLPAAFPALYTLDTRRTNLPAQITTLIGREQEIDAVCSLLRREDVRLLTLTGPGGIGKTRLGLQVAAELTASFADGVYFVDLAPIRDPGLVIATIAQTLGIREASGQVLLDRLKDELRDKHMLLLLDNFEHLLEAAPLVAELLAAARWLKLLVTSREVLHLRGEKDIPVPPLALPDDAQLPPADHLSQYAAVELFIARATDAKPDFTVTNASAPAVAEICARLDGLPLAIELAAARVKLFAPEALLGRLSSRLALLIGGPRDLPARQQTIRSTIAWSYDLLDAHEQTLFRRLGVFVGGCTLEAVEAVASELRMKNEEKSNESSQQPLLDSSFSVLESIEALVDKSLLRQVTGPDDTPRFVMLETVREYALEQLDASGEAEQLRHRHASYYMRLGESWPPERGSDDPAWKTGLDRDFDNLRAALAWSQTAAGDPELALRLAVSLNTLWWHRGLRREAQAELERALDHPLGPGSTQRRAAAQAELAHLLGAMGNYAEARRQFEQLLPLVRELGNTMLCAWSLDRLGWLAREQGDAASAWAWLGQALALFHELGNASCIAGTLNTMAGVAILEENPARAEALLAESQAACQGQAVDPEVLGWMLNHLGHAAQLRGEYERAAQLHQESLARFPSDYHAGLLWAYHDLGEAALGLGRADEAARWLRQALALTQTVSDQEILAWCLAGLGTVAALGEEPERAARLWGAAERLRLSLGARHPPAARKPYERAVAVARGQLGHECFAAAWAAGQALALEQAIAEASG